ncbi:hypothetical protein BDV59DRAFT_176010 [Aspergillus ambiguus]|uniref:uncharacterized protein n=1 Tax=Aspergillus ambiguus TaxID=176160 RepID=UPI003CCD8AB2
MREPAMCMRIPSLTIQHPLFIFLFLLQVITRASAQLCYNPNGSISNDRPCNSTAEVSVCCEDGFVCTENKLCQPMGWYDGSDGNPLQLIRSTCTDKTWKSGSCPGHCIAESPTGGEWVMRCGTGSHEYCCSDDSCCSNGGKRYDLGNATMTAIAGHQASTTSQSSPATATSTASTTTSTTPTATEPASSDSGSEGSTNSQAKTIGIGVGVGVGGGLLALGCLAFLLWRRKRAIAAAQSSDLPFQPTNVRAMEQPEPVVELDSRDRRVFSELQGKTSREVYEVE